MKKKRDTSYLKEQILKLLEQRPDELLNATDIAKELKSSTPTVSKYAMILEAEGRLEIVPVGNNNVIRLKESDDL